jgi:phytoene dehydrogenase-like protein
MQRYEATVVGAGPNGLAAAIELARAGLSVLIMEAQETIGGGAQCREFTLPGFIHDVCSAVHPLAVSSPFFSRLPLGEHGLEWITPPAALAHPLDDGAAVLLQPSLPATCDSLGEDGPAYQRLIKPLVERWPLLASDLLAPPRIPRHPLALARFGWTAWRDARSLAESLFRGARARALFGGLAAHSVLPLEQRPSAAFALILAAAAHAVGWPIPRGGSGQIASALAGYLRSLGGEIQTGTRVDSVDQISCSGLTLLDVTPRQLLTIAGQRFPESFRRRLTRYRYGPGVYKMDWALDGPIPWRAPECATAGTVHLGGSLEEIAHSESTVWRGAVDAKPFVILAQPSLFDPTRAPQGRHTAWAYCHVPNGFHRPMVEAIEGQIERFAPGFRERVMARHVMSPDDLERHNANLVGGSINGGVHDFRQMLLRPTYRRYSTPARGLYLCSSSTPPGAGVHGMCGYYAARSALRDEG